jgi:enamine deaminase RidA (YjgF/YER057c/UK114 family)
MRRVIGLMFVVLATSVAAQSSKQVFGPNPNLPFSAAVKADGLIYVSGMINAEAKSDVKAQTKATLEAIGATLKTAGSTLTNAASVTVYLRNAADFAAMNEVYSTYFPKDPPARTTIVVSQPLANADGLVEISAIAVPTGGERVVIHPKDWVRSPAPYSYGIKSGNTLFLSGLVSRNGKDNANVKGDITAQTKVVLDNGAEILKEAGMSYADVVSSRVYITDTAAFQAMNTAYRPYFTGAPPARLTVKTGLTSPDYVVEIAMVAVKDPSRTAITTPNADGSPGSANANLSSAIRVGNRLYVSGITGNTQTNRSDAKAQTTEVLGRVGRTLKAAGFDWTNVVDGTVFLADMTTFQAMNGEYRQTMTKDLPARATVGAAMVSPDILVEIMFTAVK